MTGHKYPFEATDPTIIPDIVARLRTTYNSNTSKSYEWRVEQLTILKKLVKENEEFIAHAMYKDLHRSRFEAHILEISIIIEEIDLALSNVKSWMSQKKVSTNLLNVPGTSYLTYDPYGVVLIMAPWNYPVNLLLVPLVGALAAGNTVLLRPGAFSAHTSDLFNQLISRYFAPENVNIVVGERDVTTSVLQCRFDFIFFTGGTTLGTVVAQAATRFLTPYVLELGGKSPAIVLPDTNMDVAVKRLTWGTFANAGQTCVRPDYGLVSSQIVDTFVNKCISTIKTFYTMGDDITEFAVRDHDNPRQYINTINDNASKLPPDDDHNDIIIKSPYFGRMITQQAYERVVDIIKHDKDYIVYGGKYNDTERYIQPTIMVFRTLREFETSAAMQHEIFGPIFPILAIDTLDDAISFIKQREKPLALYAYTTNTQAIDKITVETSSGNLVFNDAIVHLSNTNLPFGGVGQSGMGSYHGYFSFKCFSHEKGTLYKPTWGDVGARYPPYTSMNQFVISSLEKIQGIDFGAYLGSAVVIGALSFGLASIGLTGIQSAWDNAHRSISSWK